MPRERVSVNVEVTKYFNFSVPGTYSIELSRAPASFPGGELHSNELVVTVLPPVAGPAAAPYQQPEMKQRVAGPSTGPAARDLSLRIEMDWSSIGAGRQIPVYSVLTNISGRVITIAAPSTLDDGYYGIDVRDQAGASMPEIPLSIARNKMIAQGTGRLDPHPLPSGGSWKSQTDLLNCVEIKSPGVYTIQFWIRVPEELGGGEIRSNELTLTVRPNPR
jgi:hypothetical protein